MRNSLPIRKLLSLVIAAAMFAGLMITGASAAPTSLTRAQLAKLLVEAAGRADQVVTYAEKASAFSDVPDGSPYEGYINLASELGFLNGTGGGRFSPDDPATQLQAATIALRSAGTPGVFLQTWPGDCDALARDSGLVEGIPYDSGAPVTASVFQTMLDHAAQLADRPYIGISWKSNTQDYEAFKLTIRTAGGIPVELKQVKSTAVGYDAAGEILPAYTDPSGKLSQQYADSIKRKDLSQSNVGEVMKEIDGVFFTGGEDISPSLLAVPQPEANHGEEINATRDISDYTLMAYCFQHDVPTFAACRGMQMMSIVSGADFIQDIGDYYREQGVSYHNTHCMPPEAPNQDYIRHDVEILTEDSIWLYDTVGADTLEQVSSWHHQAVRSLEGTDLTAVATATCDGVEIIEGVEKQSQTFCLGVQFHPEIDCKLALYDRKPEAALCDIDICLTFSENLVAYAADRPVIGISWGGDPLDYVDMQDMVRDGGGVVTHIPQITGAEDAATAIHKVDGIIVTGGEDINPDLYGEEPSPLLEDNNEFRDLRDTSDYNLIQAAVSANVPMLCVCRGMQMLNVALGGGMIQDLPETLGTTGDEYKVHRNAPDWAWHDVQILREDSVFLNRIVDGDSLSHVASWHHQVVNPERIGKGLTITAFGPDNVIEAMEYQENEFTLGIQFHPEADARENPQSQAFFDAIVAYAGN